MKSFNNKGIKDIIAEFPEVGNVLEEYGIGCGPCTVGICRLNDILDIHTMEPEKEKELMMRIEAVIYPERGLATPATTNITRQAQTPLIYSPPMQKLVDEHVVIKRWLALIPTVVDTLDLQANEGVEIVENGIDLIRTYADRLHHAKEEDILFKYFDDTAEIFQVIYEDHKKARNHVKEMLAALEKRDEPSLAYHLTEYKDLLAEHIKKEDEILFPWLDRKLNKTKVVELSDRFDKEDQEIGIDGEKYILFLDRLEHQFQEEV